MMRFLLESDACLNQGAYLRKYGKHPNMRTVIELITDERFL